MPARRIDVELDVALRVFPIEEEQLRHDQVGDLVVDRSAQKDDALLEQQRVNIVGAFAAPRLFDNHRNHIVSFLISAQWAHLGGRPRGQTPGCARSNA